MWTVQPSFARIAPASASIAAGSPCTRNVSLRRRLKAAEPAQDLRRVGVRRHRFDLAIAACTGIIWPWILTDGAPSTSCRPACLPPGSRPSSTVFAGRAARLEVMQHAAAGGHAARRDDDRRHLRLRELLRFRGRRDGAETVGAERADAAARAPPARGASAPARARLVVRRLVVALLRLQLGIELVQPLGVARQRLHRHRAVDEDRQHRNALLSSSRLIQ